MHFWVLSDLIDLLRSMEVTKPPKNMSNQNSSQILPGNLNILVLKLQGGKISKNAEMWSIFEFVDWVCSKYRAPNIFLDLTDYIYKAYQEKSEY